jgi:acyl-CoA thioesterase I
MLRARGSNSQITNAGVSGATTAQVLASLSSAVPEGTRVVILGLSSFNDVRKGDSVPDARANIAAIKKRLAARGIRVVDALGIIKSILRQPGMQQPDGIHLTAEAHHKVAMQLAGSVR